MSSVPLAVEIRHLVKEYRLPSSRQVVVRAVDDVSLQINQGEVYGLIGPNGSGKSTTMKALLGLVAPTRGHCLIYGKDSLRVDSRRDVGFLPENPYFYKHLTGAETLRFYGKLCDLRGVALEQRITELLKLVDLQSAADRRLGGYSKGMLQRIGLAQAMIQDPRLLILDEPTAGVDPLGSRQIRDLILRLRERGMTVFMCSHLLEQVQEVCDRVGMVYQGRMVLEGQINEIVAIENQTELVLENANQDLLARLRQLIADDGSARLLSVERPRTTLESLFLEKTTSSSS